MRPMRSRVYLVRGRGRVRVRVGVGVRVRGPMRSRVYQSRSEKTIALLLLTKGVLTRGVPEQE